jgi:hypothetical protein
MSFEKGVFKMKKSIIAEPVKMVWYKAKNLSVNGNPKARIVWETMDGEEIDGVTATDAACGYGYRNYEHGKLASIEYHVTRTGNIIFDYIRDYKEV